VDQLDAEVVAMHQVVRDLRTQAAGCESTGAPSGIYSSLYQVFTGTDVQISRTGGVTVLTLPASLLFTNAYNVRLRAEASMALDLLATAIKDHPDQQIQVTGHTDNATVPLGSIAANNLDLSYLYAMAVTKELTERFGADPAMFTVAASGQGQPVASNDVALGQAANRRVVVTISPPKGT